MGETNSRKRGCGLFFLLLILLEKMILLYDEKWLQEFDGNIDPNTVNFKELANSLEKYTSQYVYKYKTNIKKF